MGFLMGFAENFAVEINKENLPSMMIEIDKTSMKSSKHNGVYYRKRDARWIAMRRSKKQKKCIFNGTYKNEEIAAHASDTLARKLMRDGESNHYLNFPDDETEVKSKVKTPTSKYIGVYFKTQYSRWVVQRYSKKEKKYAYFKSYMNEEEAAYASDTLARELMQGGEKGHKLNFTDGEYYRFYGQTEQNNMENEGIYSKRRKNSVVNSENRQEYFVYRME